MQRQSSQAARLLTAAQQGNAPERRAEQLHLLQLYLRLHRQAYERAGDEPSAVRSRLRKEQGSTVPNREMQRRLLCCKTTMACCMNSLHRRTDFHGAVLCCSCQCSYQYGCVAPALWQDQPDQNKHACANSADAK